MEYGFAPRTFGTPFARLLLVLLLLANLAVWYAWIRADLWLPPRLDAALRVTFFDVGQGDAMLVETPRGRRYLVDGGDGGSERVTAQAGHSGILDHLSRRRIRHLDGIVVTHFHNDHLGGVTKVLNELPVDRVWDAGGASTLTAFQKYEEILKRRRIPRLRVRAGDRLDWGKELDALVLHPEPELPGAEPAEQNARSVVLLLRYGKGAVLLPGDIERDEQRELARYGAGLRAQVFKIPNHGAVETLFIPLLEAVSPKEAILSVGRDNPFGYPASSTIQAYAQRGIKVWRTDLDGTLMATIGGGGETESKVEVDRSR